MTWLIIAAIVLMGFLLLGATAFLLVAAEGKRRKSRMHPTLADRDIDRTHPAEWEADSDE